MNNTPTAEMIEWFYQRTMEHLVRVALNLRLLEGFRNVPRKVLDDRGSRHDISKYLASERDPYIWLTWMYKCKREKVPFQYPPGVEEQVDTATRHHILTNSHHPEFHLAVGDLEDFSRDDADKGKTLTLVIRQMPDLDIMEMCCDWCAMSEELDQNGGSPRSWADAKIGKRWAFTEDNVQLIYETISELEKRKGLPVGPLKS